MRRPKFRAMICVCISLFLVLNYNLWRVSRKADKAALIEPHKMKVGDNNSQNSRLTSEQILTNRLTFEPKKIALATPKPFVAVVACAVAKGVSPQEFDHMALTKFMLPSLLKVNTVCYVDFDCNLKQLSI